MEDEEFASGGSPSRNLIRKTLLQRYQGSHVWTSRSSKTSINESKRKRKKLLSFRHNAEIENEVDSTEDQLKRYAGALERLSPKVGKVPLPRPYRKHWQEIENRRATREFIDGKDEDYDFAERDIRVKTPCVGVLCFHALELLDLVVNRQSFLNNVPISYYCMLSIGMIRRCTKIVHAINPKQIKMDTFLHLSIEISEWREAPNNKLRIELWSFQDPENHFIVGTVEIHIYNFIRLQHTIEQITLWSDGLKVGKLAYEVAFSYGAFGYGHSNQLKNFSQPIMETISHSMFPRIKLDPVTDIADQSFQTRLPDKLKLFTYHSLILEVEDKDPRLGAFFGNKPTRRRFNRVDLQPKPITVQQVEFEQGFPVHCKLHMNIYQKPLQADFNDMYGEYVCFGHKRERLDYLSNLVQGTMRDLYEEEAPTLFEYIKPRDLDQINRIDTNPNELIFPPTIPCPTSEAFTINMEDEKFQDKFPPVRRETGYLSTLFGFNDTEKAEETVVEQTDDINYLKTHGLAPVQTAPKEECHVWNWGQNAIVRFKAFLIRTFNFIFPDLQHPLDIPEISVSIASPEGSTSNVYAYFTRETKDPNSTKSKVDRLVKQTTALIDMARKTQIQRKGKYKTSSESSSSSSDDDEEGLRQSIRF